MSEDDEYTEMRDAWDMEPWDEGGEEEFLDVRALEREYQESVGVLRNAGWAAW
jgi:hypothetical protein